MSLKVVSFMVIEKLSTSEIPREPSHTLVSKVIDPDAVLPVGAVIVKSKVSPDFTGR